MKKKWCGISGKGKKLNIGKEEVNMKNGFLFETSAIKKRKEGKRKMNKLNIAALVVMLFFCVTTVSAKTYTLDADFDEGTLVGLEHETVHDQLQLSIQAAALPFIWVPNNEGTISKVDTETGNELGRYRIAPFSNCSPSRTTVDLKGNCWVGNRQAGTVVKVGLYEAGQYIDRNGDGVIQTSMDTNGDGNITGGEILPWGEDECVLYEVVLIPGLEGTFAPGQYPGPYDTNYWGTAPRGLAIDANNNLWAGTYSTSKYYYINGENGAILKTVDVSPWGHHAYGTVIDIQGILWSSGHTSNHVLRLDPSTDPPTINTVDIGHFAYGLGLDYFDHLFISGWDWGLLSRVSLYMDVKEWTKPLTYGSRGVTCTSDNDVWLANSWYGTVLRHDNDGNFKVSIPAGAEPTGVAVDAAGKVWVCNNGDEYIKRIDPATNAIDLSKAILGSGGHYSYSDMTGIVARSITTLTGNWTVVYDSGVSNTPWGTISWTSDVPAGASVIVKVRSSNGQVSWSDWETASNGATLTATPNGQYLQIETTLQLVTGELTPTLYDLTVESAITPTPTPSTSPTPEITPSPIPSPTGTPTAITLAYFHARSGKDGSVTLTWQTATEVDNAGFNLYRANDKDGDYTKINESGLIPARGNAVSGASYSYVDTPGKGTFYYTLEDVDYYGVSTMHGPEKARARSDNATTKKQKRK
ncbi:MAG: hypothetical protein NG747_12325 [Candidatus Brocadia sp.]|nr:hypothetical protein [Candidatus Brocadia sp.]